MVMVRESSGCSIAALASVRTFWLPKPVRSHNTSYSGTSAKPNAKLPSAKASSFIVRRWFARSLMRSGLAHRHHDECHVEGQCHETEQPGGAACLRTPRADFFRRHGRRSHQCCTPRATSSRDGGSVQLWYGGGELSSHSRPRAPSQERPSDFEPAFTHFQMMYGNSSCDRPKPNAPSEDTRFQSANCTE